MSRILFIITQSEIGGAQRYLLELAPYLAAQGHDVSVAAGEDDGALFEQFSINSQISIIKTRGIPSLIRKLSPLRDLFALVKILKIIKKERPDILFLQSTKAGFLGSLAAKLYEFYYFMFRVPCSMRVIYRIGGWAFHDPRPWWMNRIIFWMEKVSATWKDVIIVNSEFDRQITVDKKIAPSEKIVKIYNGLDPKNLNFWAKEAAKNFILSKIPHDREKILLVGTIANLYATKGIEYLIEAANILTTNYKLQTINYIVVGEGKERTKLEALIKKYGLQDKLFLMGRIPDATQYLKAFDIFVLPSVKEGFPWVLLEAMAAEVPIVATKVGALPEILENKKEGLLVPSKNSNALAEKISQLIQNTHDREEYVKNATKKLRAFSLQKMLRESEEIIK